MPALAAALSVTDLFCGAGGSSQGAEDAGVRLALGLNHWDRAIQTHAADHDLTDVSVCDPRYYPRSDLLIASPECTAHSYANGVSRKLARRSLFDQPDPGAERSRATMWDVVRFMEAHRYQAVIVENVVNVRDWELFEPWLHAVRSVRPGYQTATVYLNSMVAWPTPQSRDRLYTVIWRNGAKAPVLRFDVLAWCPACERVVAAVQSWKDPRRPWGRYSAQYTYRCPACTQSTWPLVHPAATAIDWTLEAPRIGDRARPLAANTLARIRAGLARYLGQPPPMLVQVAGHTCQRQGSTCRVRDTDQPFPVQTTTPTHGLAVPPLLVPINGHLVDPAGSGRRVRAVHEPTVTMTADKALSLLVPSGGTWAEGARPVDHPGPTQTAHEAWGLPVPTEARTGQRARSSGEPLRTQTTRAELGLCVPLVIEARRHATGRPVSEPVGCVTAKGNHHYLAVPPGWLVANYGNGQAVGKNGWVRGLEEPAGTVTTRDHHTLLVPYNRTGQPRRPSQPLRTVTTHDREAVLELARRVEDCGFRMLQPSEIQAAMAFRPGYQVLGSKRERVRQLGNAVTPPVMRLLMARVLDALT
jgi:DNA (cytosine-5)-methyltransferase 1